MKKLQTLSDNEIRERIKNTPLLGRYGPHVIDRLLQEIARRQSNRRNAAR